MFNKVLQKMNEEQNENQTRALGDLFSHHYVIMDALLNISINFR